MDEKDINRKSLDEFYNTKEKDWSRLGVGHNQRGTHKKGYDT